MKRCRLAGTRFSQQYLNSQQVKIHEKGENLAFPLPLEKASFPQQLTRIELRSTENVNPQSILTQSSTRL